MNGLPYYRAYPRDFFEGTIGMDLEAKGAYRLLLDLIYMHGGRLADDSRFISGHLGCSVKKWIAIRATILATGKITACQGYLANHRADKELDALGMMQSKQRANGSKPKKINRMSEATAYPNQNHTEPEPDTEEERGKPLSERVSEKPANRFDEFWETYPHRGGAKRGKKPAEAKYALAVKSGIPEQTLIDGARRYAGDAQVQRGFAKDPTTWLNQAGWQDEIEIPNLKTINGGKNGQHEFDRTILQIADGLSAGTVSLDYSNRDPFTAR